MRRPGGRAELRARAERYVDLAYNDGKGGDNATGVRWWYKFCAFGLETEPGRVLDVSAPLQAKLDEELILMEFACWLVQVRKVAPETARKYVSTVQAWHGRRFGVRLAGGLTLARLPAMLKGMVVAEGGKRPRRLRVGVRPKALAKAMEICFTTESPAEANWEAAMTVGFCGLLRGKELGRGDRAALDATRDLTRADVRFLRRGGRKYAVLYMHPCDKGVIGVQGKTVKLVLGGGGIPGSRVRTRAPLRRG